ncbi:hypothetical protein RJ527_08700 [Thalassospiraceae bacterium LMO-SO8]|nr:hypothetical protein [Alphaproteobacteria bacterium LMO-S08]WND77809.1 hypothetical protein RJ527_08700 [Thalassospiraceae bacterium LMO-SO8]
MTGPETEWPWRPEDFFQSATANAGATDGDRAARLAARCFRSTDGAALLSYLKALTLDRALGPDATDATLRHLEGQRHLVRHLSHLIDLGRAGPDASPASKGDDA